MNRVPALLAATAAICLASAALAEGGLATSDLNLRAGPGTAHAVLATIPRGGEVEIIGCLRSLDWCEVRWRGARGWASAGHLAVPRPAGTLLVPKDRASRALPTVEYDARNGRRGDHREGKRNLSRWEDRLSVRTNRLTDGSFGRHGHPAVPNEPDRRAMRPALPEFNSRARPPAFSRGSPFRRGYDSRGGWRGID